MLLLGYSNIIVSERMSWSLSIDLKTTENVVSLLK